MFPIATVSFICGCVQLPGFFSCRAALSKITLPWSVYYQSICNYFTLHSGSVCLHNFCFHHSYIPKCHYISTGVTGCLISIVWQIQYGSQSWYSTLKGKTVWYVWFCAAHTGPVDDILRDKFVFVWYTCDDDVIKWKKKIRVTSPLCGEFTGPGEFPSQRPLKRNFDIFFNLRLNKRLSKQPWGWWFETLSSLWRRHYDAIVIMTPA